MPKRKSDVTTELMVAVFIVILIVALVATAGVSQSSTTRSLDHAAIIGGRAPNATTGGPKSVTVQIVYEKT